MPTAQVSLRAVSPWRNGALSPYPASANTQPKRTPAAMTRSISAKAISGFVRVARYSRGTPARFNRARSLVQPSGRNNRNARMTGTSPSASVRDTRVWQLRVLLSAGGYWAPPPPRMRALLGYRGVIDHQHGIVAADEPIRLNKQFCLHRRRIPDPGRNEVGQLIIVAKCKPLSHRLNALAIARADQPRYVARTHLPPRLVT